jgi:tetratricopeptide (TPR) repeat protein
MTAARPSSERRLAWMLSLGLGLTVAAVFARAVGAEFLRWDDDINIFVNPHIQALNLENLRWMFTDTSYVRRYMPLAWLGFALNNAIFGATAISYHAGNVLLHALNSVLVFFIVLKLLRLAAPTGAGGEATPRLLAAAGGALLWAVNPLRVEVVAWASARIYCQTACLLLLSVLAYLHAATATGRARPYAYLASVLAYAASLLTYPIGLALPAALVVLDWHPLKRFHAGLWKPWPARRAWLEKLPFLVVGTAVFAVTLWARAHASGMWEDAAITAHFGILPRIMQAFYVWAYFAWKPWWPFDLAPVYTTLVWFQPGDAPFVLSLIGVVAVTALLLWQRGRWRGPLAAWLAYLALMVPLLGLTEHPHYPNDRYSYFVGLLWAVVIAGALVKLWPKLAWRKVALAGGLTLAVVWGVTSVRLIGPWRNSLAFFESALSRLGQDRYRGDIHWRLGLSLTEAGRTNEAIPHFTAAIRLLPKFPEAHLALADALETAGHREQALPHYVAAARISPTTERRIVLALALARAGRTAEAIAQYRALLQQAPATAPALNNLAWLLATTPEASLRDGAEAVRLAERACALAAHKQPLFIGTLAAAYAEAGRFSEAVQAAQQAAELAQAAGDTHLAATNQKLLELYRRGRPYRDEPAPIHDRPR